MVSEKYKFMKSLNVCPSELVEWTYRNYPHDKLFSSWESKIFRISTVMVRSLCEDVLVEGFGKSPLLLNIEIQIGFQENENQFRVNMIMYFSYNPLSWVP